MKLQDYLKQRHAPGTVKRYYRDIVSYIDSVGQAQAQTAKYSDIMTYIATLRKQYNNPETIKCTLQGIKKYYFWLIQEDIRKDHPCRNLHLKDKRNSDIQLQDLFATQELELLLERKGRYKDVNIKNQVVISLLIYQAVTRNDLTRITLKDINLEEGTIYIKSDTKTNARTLKLKTKQIMLLYKYINEVRTKWRRYSLPCISTHETDQLLITNRGTPETGECLKHLFKPFKKYFPGRTLHAKTIRQSVIANLLKEGKDLRLVQTFAGHKYPSSTEKYRQTGIEQLKAGVEKYHPLNR